MNNYFVANSDSISRRVRINGGPTIRPFICVSIAMMLACLAGCQRVQPTTDSETSSEPLQTSEILSQNTGDGNKEIQNIQKCGPTTLNAEDAKKWECVPDIGYWCIDPDGCPVEENIAAINTRLILARPVPQGNQYAFFSSFGRFSSALDKGKRILSTMDPYFDAFKKVDEWRCINEEGCTCGEGRIEYAASCYGDTYQADSGSADSACNARNCNAFCRDNKCVCGDIVMNNDMLKGYQCIRDAQLCMDKDGCDANGRQFLQYQNWTDYKLICNDSHGCACRNTSCRFHDTCMLHEGRCIVPDKFECEDKNGCSCGTITCTEYENCIPAENKCILRYVGTIRTTDRPILSDTTWKEESATCSNESGCKCGSQLCPKDFICIDNTCVYKRTYGDGSSGAYAFYCDKPEGCACSNHPVACPQGSVCDYWSQDQHQSNGFGYRCAKVDKDKVKDEQSLFEFLKTEDAGNFLHKIRGSDIIFSEIYGSDQDVAQHQNYYLDKKDGKNIGIYVVCSQPGCDCNGVPLANDYLCVEQHVVFAHDKSDEYGICKWPYYGFTHDKPDSGGSCDIADNVYEQICFNPKGCNCGSGTIPMGDTCVDGHAQCSTLKPRPGCKCGSEKPGTGYGCYQKQLICQNKSCACHGKTIHLGDICTKGDKNCNANHHLTTDICVGDVICGADSQTTGCMCGEKALREGYRCFQKEQLCACHIPNEESDDFEDTDSDADNCTCRCGEQSIANGAVCGDDDKPEPKQITFDETKCGKVDDIDPEDVLVEYKSRKYEVDRSIPELSWLACTCGTGKEAPGEGYKCAFKTGIKGGCPECTSIILYAGWQCHKYEGCECGDTTCHPGDLCAINEDDTKSCVPFKTVNGNCRGHVFPLSYVYENGYGCYYDYPAGKYANGWYCRRPEGCACGDATCEQWQMCVSPGNCSKRKLDSESEQNELKLPLIESCDGCGSA